MMATTVHAAEKPFIRTRITWLGYSLMALFGFCFSLLGPAMPFIGDKLGLTYTEMGYHFAMGAVGGILASLVGDRVARWLGTTRLCWGGALLMSLTLPGVTFGTSLGMTLSFTFLYALGVSLVALITIATIADAHTQHTTKAYAEGNIVGGLAAIAGPILIGFIAVSPLGWQAVGFLPLLGLVIIAVLFRGLPIPEARSETQPQSSGNNSASLPRLFWVFGVLVFFFITIEFLFSAWGANFLSNVVGYAPSTAASLVSVFAVALVLGRLVGRRLLDIMPESRLMVLSLAWVILTFPLYWLSTVPLLNVIGLFLAGLGVGNLGLLGMAGAMAAAAGQTNRASARLGFFPNLANLTLLQLVGVLADSFGIQQAHAVLLVVAILAIGFALFANRMRAAQVAMQQA